MAVYTVLGRKALASFVEDYGLGRLTRAAGVPAGSVNTHYLLETRKGKFFLKIDEVKNQPEARRELELLLFLHAQGFTCPRPLADRQGHYQQEYEGKAVSLYPYLAGKTFSEAALTPTHLEQAGQALASLHFLGQGYKKGIENRFSFERVIELYQAVRAKLPGYFRHVIHTLDDEVAHQQQYQEERLSKGIIHGDLFADNLLFRGGKIVGVLDFEAACYGKLIYDLATAVNALCYTEGGYLIERFAALLRGYQSIRTLSLTEWDAFPNELRFSALRFTVTRLKDFFLRPMDDRLRINKDFREFFERLLVLRRERPGGMDRLLLAMATGYDYRKYQQVHTQGKPSGNRTRAKRRNGTMQWVSTPSAIAANGNLRSVH
jgi:homoserine kinase type II